MVSNYPEIHQHASLPIPQPANYSYFTEQAIRGTGQESGRTQHEHFGDHLRQQNVHPHPHPQPRFFPQPYSHEMHEVIQREIEKERIREEIIMSEIVRMQAEARREQLMMERELALRRGSNGFIPYGSSSVMGFDSQRLPLWGTRVEGRSLEERIMLSLTDRERLNGRRHSDF